MGEGAMISLRGLSAMVAKKMIGNRQNSPQARSRMVRPMEKRDPSDISPSPT